VRRLVALGLVIFIELFEDEDSAKIPDVSIVEASAELLYGLVHQRYILTRAGLQAMVRRRYMFGAIFERLIAFFRQRSTIKAYLALVPEFIAWVVTLFRAVAQISLVSTP
jgi:hypothetical protein